MEAESALPEVRDPTPLDYGDAVISAFNKLGTLLAVGCHDGRVVIWDFGMFKNVYRTLIGHVNPVSALSWSPDGRMLLSASSDWNVFVWDVLDGAICKRLSFGAPVLHAQFHPTNPDLIVACPLQMQTVLHNLRTGEQRLAPVPGHLAADKKAAKGAAKQTPKGGAKSAAKKKSPARRGGESQRANGSGARREGEAAVAVKNFPAPPHYTVFDRVGKYLYYGDHKGKVTIMTVEGLEQVKVFTVKAGASVKSLTLSQNGRMLLVNCSDKTLRVLNACYSVDEDVAPEEMTWLLIGEFLDPINRLQWKTGTFSSDGMFLIGGSSERAEHKIFIWNCQFSQALAKTLEGPKQGIVHLTWHPRESIIISCSSSGLVYVWTASRVEPWSAYAPDFKELEENTEYVEREDEFDILDEEMMSDDSGSEVDEVVDIMDISDGEEPEADYLRHLPCIPEPDVPTVPEHMQMLVQ